MPKALLPIYRHVQFFDMNKVLEDLEELEDLKCFFVLHPRTREHKHAN